MIQPFLYSGTGNTFALIDNRELRLEGKSATALRVCKELRVDGLLVIEESRVAEIKMEIYNPDGSHAEMCGNGSRCVAYWAHTRANFPDVLRVESRAGVLDAVIRGDVVKIRIPQPTDIVEVSQLKTKTETVKGYHINTGVPHTVIEVLDLNRVDVAGLGRQIRQHPRFKPNGTNVCFMKSEDEGIAVRTYERGVEAETLSCGTGATASALVSAFLHHRGSPLRVMTRSGEPLWIHFLRERKGFSNVYLEGAVKQIEPPVRGERK